MIDIDGARYLGSGTIVRQAVALAVLPVMAFQGGVVEAGLRGGIFQDFAPSFFHLENVMGPVLRRMGLEVEMEMRRPGYVPRGGGILWLRVRSAEAIGRRVAGEILKEVKSGAAVDKCAADQVLPFAALAEGENRFRIPGGSENVECNAWLVRKFLRAGVEVDGQEMRVKGGGFERT
jgi:RNA 3'-terminal phosphate cyclase